MIRYFDLSKQTAILKKEIMNEISSVLDTGDFCNGSYVREFEKEFANVTGTEFVSGVSSGTSALILALKALRLGKDDEVIVPAYTFIATASAVVNVGCKPIFVDCELDTANISVDEIKKAITPKTRCIIVVHMYGNPVNLDEIINICKEYKISLIEDCAQAFGSTYSGKMVGGFGEMGCYSFYPSKNIGAFGEAGAVITNNADYMQVINQVREHGALRKYHHTSIGYNMKMDSMQAVVLLVKMRYYQQNCTRRQRLAKQYMQCLSNSKIKLIKHLPKTNPVNHLFVIIVEDRNDFREYMLHKNIETALHYPTPLHLQPAFSFLSYKSGDFPCSEYISNHVVSLPFYPELSDEEIDYVINCINQY